MVRRVTGHVAFVEVTNTGQCKGCGARLICQPELDSPVTVRAANTISARPGQKVNVHMIPGLLSKMTMIHYGLPLLGFVLGVFAVSYGGLTLIPAARELGLFLGGVVGLLACGFFAWVWAGRIAGQVEAPFEISGVYSED